MLSILLAGAGLYTALKMTEKATESKKETLEKESLQEELKPEDIEPEPEQNYALMYYTSRVDKWVKDKFPNSIRWEYYFEMMPDGHRKILQPEIQDSNIIHVFLDDGTDAYERVDTFNLIPTRHDFKKNEQDVPDEANIWLSENIQNLIMLQKETSKKGYSSATYKVENKNVGLIDKIIEILQHTTEWEVEKAADNSIFFTWPIDSSIVF